MFKAITAGLAFATLLGACTADMVAPSPQPTSVVASSPRLDKSSGQPSENATHEHGIACTLNSATCPTPFGLWSLDVNWNTAFDLCHAENEVGPDCADAWFTNDYNGANEGHFKITAVYVTACNPFVEVCIGTHYKAIVDDGRIDGAKVAIITTRPRGRGQTGN